MSDFTIYFFIFFLINGLFTKFCEWVFKLEITNSDFYFVIILSVAQSLWTIFFQ
ncbi:MAG: hypothetical protein WCJ84_00505 [Candidatus Peregrinibacteria bacterium]